MPLKTEKKEIGPLFEAELTKETDHRTFTKSQARLHF